MTVKMTVESNSMGFNSISQNFLVKSHLTLAARHPGSGADVDWLFHDFHWPVAVVLIQYLKMYPAIHIRTPISLRLFVLRRLYV